MKRYQPLFEGTDEILAQRFIKLASSHIVKGFNMPFSKVWIDQDHEKGEDTAEAHGNMLGMPRSMVAHADLDTGYAVFTFSFWYQPGTPESTHPKDRVNTLEVSVKSPSKSGGFRKMLTGRNATWENALKTVDDICLLKVKRK